MRFISEMTQEKIELEAQYLMATLANTSGTCTMSRLLAERIVRDIAYGFMVEGLPGRKDGLSTTTFVDVADKYGESSQAWVVHHKSNLTEDEIRKALSIPCTAVTER